MKRSFTLLLLLALLIQSCTNEEKCTGSKSFPFQFKGLKGYDMNVAGSTLNFDLVPRYSCIDSIYLTLNGNRKLIQAGEQSITLDLAPGIYKLLAEGITADGKVEKSTHLVITPKSGTQQTQITEWSTKPHNNDHYTQGLEFYKGKLYESTGQPGESRIGPLSSSLDAFEKSVTLEGKQFGEGMTILNNQIYQITWLDGICYVRDIESLEEIRRFNYTGQGWGLTNDGKNLYMSDGTAYIYEKDPKTFSTSRTLRVYDSKGFVEKLNELAFINGKIWANIYLTNRIAIIDPASGFVERYIEGSALVDNEKSLNPNLRMNDQVLNGIAYDQANDLLYLTGKDWQNFYLISLSQLAFK